MEEIMRVLVCGGRGFNDRDMFESVMNNAASRTAFLRVIQGGASGADAMAREWCVKWRYAYEHFPADWRTHGKAAGPIRNQRMIDEGKPDLVIAFPGGRGTADMVRRAKAAGLQVVEAGA
jgi:hypothetical protein